MCYIFKIDEYSGLLFTDCYYSSSSFTFLKNIKIDKIIIIIVKKVNTFN